MFDCPLIKLQQRCNFTKKHLHKSHVGNEQKPWLFLVIYRIILYCWWKKSCTTGYVWNPVNNGTFNTVFTNDVGIILSHSKDPVMNQPGFHGMSSCFFSLLTWAGWWDDLSHCDDVSPPHAFLGGRDGGNISMEKFLVDGNRADGKVPGIILYNYTYMCMYIYIYICIFLF